LATAKNGLLESWNVGKSEDLYGINQWGKGYFRINSTGNISIHPDKDHARGIDLFRLVERVREMGYHPPLLFRFPGILRHRFADMHAAFADARREANYKGGYRCVFRSK
jgi:arginine decarboxylase